MHTRNTQKNIRGERGFTIVEVLISLTIFSIAVAGVITVAAQGGLNVNAVRNKLIASYLADEGIELMRGVRDTYVVQEPIGDEDKGWTAFTAAVAACSSGPSTLPCDVDALNTSGAARFPDVSNIVACPLAGCPLYYDTATGFYRNFWSGPAPASVFSRKITVDPVPLSPDEMKITVTVSWKDGIAPQSITESEHIFNWY
jgi:prepilin-type N-terminal cleavage/methylation domain-containing protein